MGEYINVLMDDTDVVDNFTAKHINIHRKKMRSGYNKRGLRCQDTRLRMQDCYYYKRHHAGVVKKLLAEGIDTYHLIADKAYDSEEITKKLKEKSIKAVIPARANKKTKR